MAQKQNIITDPVEHYGTKGMKWGVRKKKTSDKNNPPRAQDLSDEELRQRLKRLDMEQRYTKLTTTPDRRQRAKDFVQDALVNATKQTVTNLAVKQMTKTLTKAISS